MPVTPPPQAYTRDMLAHAYEWLQEQPENVRNMANTVDAMVALYLQAKRRGHNSMNTSPVSAQTFKQDLKTLAEGLKQFDPEPQQQASPPAAPTPAPAAPTQPAQALPQPAVPQLTFTESPRAHTPSASLDDKTRQMVQTVREKLNISNDEDVIRMLVAIGFERVREILPK